MDKIDYLLLDYVSDYRIRVSTLLNKNEAIHLNKPPHLLSVDALQKRLFELNRLGLVDFHNSDESRKIYVSKYTEITPEIVLGLSGSGGEAWEGVFNPNWDEYIQTIIEYPEDQKIQRVSLSSSNRKLIDKLVSNIIELTASATIAHQSKDIGSWYATYWKLLSRGYQAIIHLGVEEDCWTKVVSTREWHMSWEEVKRKLS